MPKIKRVVMAATLLATALLGRPATVGAFNVLGPTEHWAPDILSVYVCWQQPPPQGASGSISGTYWQAIKNMDAQAYDLSFSTFGSLSTIDACQDYLIGRHRTYKLFWATHILNSGAIATTIVDSRDSGGYIQQASTFINPSINWWYLTGKQNCVVWNCRPDLFTMAQHETGHTMGLAHRGYSGDPPPEHPWTWCHGGYDNEQVVAGCPHTDSRGRLQGRDVMYPAAADGYRRWLTADDIAGINYWYQ